MAKLNILHIIWSGTTGGIEMQVAQLCHAQQGNPLIKSAVLICKKEAETELLNRFRDGSFSVYHAGLSSGFDIRRSRRLYLGRLFSEFDILHIHSFNPLVSLLAVQSGKKIVYTEHGNFGYGRKRSVSERFARHLQNAFLNHRIDFMTFNSEFTEKAARGLYKLRKVKSRVVPNGVDFDALKAQGLNTTDNLASFTRDRFVVGVVARFVAVKRIDRFLRVFSEFCKGRNTVLLLVGDGPQRPVLEKIVDDLGISDHVLMTGFINHPLAYQQQMHVQVLPTLNEAFGLAVVEALFAGKPVLVYADGGATAGLIGGLEALDVTADNEGMLKRLIYYFENRQEINRHGDLRK